MFQKIKEAFDGLGELQKRIVFTLFALVIYRIGSFIPLPGVNASVVMAMFEGSGGMLGMFDVFSGGSLSRMSVLALNIFPYISASIVVQLMSTASKTLSELRKEGESGRVKINQYTRYLAIAIAAVQGYAVAMGLSAMPAVGGVSAVVNPGMGFVVSTVVALIGGTAFVMWLAEQITARGLGQGASLLIFAGIVAEIPGGIGRLIAMGNVGSVSPFMLFVIAAFAVGIIAFIAFFEQAQRRIQILYPRQAGQATSGQPSSYLPLKINMAGVMGPVFAASIMMLPAFVMRFVQSESFWFQQVMTAFTYGTWTYMIMYAGLIAFFTFFQTAVIFNSEDTANNLKNAGGYVPGIRPGATTQTYLDNIVSKTTVIGASYLVFVCVLPIILETKFAVPIAIGGTSVLILSSVALDTFNQIQSYIVSKQYASVLKRVNKKSRFRV